MNPPPELTTEVLALCDRLFDGDFTSEDRKRLEFLVLSSPEACRVYLEYAQIPAALKEARLTDVSLQEVVNMKPDQVAKQHLRFGAWSKPLLAAAAALGILAAGWSLGVWKSEKGQSKVMIATLVEAKGARWDSGSMTTEIGAMLSSGRLRLAAGLAILEFRREARLTLEGPADLELLTMDECVLHRGALTAHVPPAAVGFVVRTANATLVDHGTDFGISTTEGGDAQVQVFLGEVELQHATSGESLQLLARQSASITAQTLSRSTRLEDETIQPPSSQREPRGPNVLTLTTAEGTGKAAYAWSPQTLTHFSETLLLLKNCTTPECRRKAWLGFDLSKLQGREVREAALTLTFEPTGWGYASLLPDSRFTVYGLLDDTLDGWAEENLAWDNAPANDQNGSSVDLSKAVPLGSFDMPQGVLEGAFTLRGEALAKFLQDDHNRYATLIVVRETTELKSGAAVHGFAGNQHPTLRPPTLRLELR